MALYRIPTLHQAVRTTRPSLIVMHTNEGPQAEGGAVAVARYTQTTVGGYHEIVDDRDVVICAAPNMVVNGAGGVNAFAYHICMVGAAAQGLAAWSDPYGQQELAIAASRARSATALFGLPIVRLAPDRLEPPNRGLCGHADVSVYHPASQGHTDPGAAFPWDEFLARVGTAPVVSGGTVKWSVWHASDSTSTKYGGQPTALVCDIGTPPGVAWTLNDQQLETALGGGLPLVHVPGSWFDKLVVLSGTGAPI